MCFLLYNPLAGQPLKKHKPLFMFFTGWLLLLAIAGLVVFIFTDTTFMTKKVRTYLFATILAFVFAQIVSSVFFLVDDVRRIIQWIVQKIFTRNKNIAQIEGDNIPRSVFLNWIGLAAGTTLFGSLIYGFTNKYNYRVKRIKLAFDNLPAAFNGLKIVHFSDVHSGSFMNKKAVEEGVKKIIEQNGGYRYF